MPKRLIRVLPGHGIRRITREKPGKLNSTQTAPAPRAFLARSCSRVTRAQTAPMVTCGCGDMTFAIKKSGAWTTPATMKRKAAGSWVDIATVKAKKAGSWV